MRINFRFSGAGGQGVILSSVLLAKAYGLGSDYNISQTQSYGPESRGGACKAEVVISDTEIDYMKVDYADVFIAFNQVGSNKYYNKTKKESIILINDTLVEETDDSFYRVPATDISDELGKPFTVNMVMLGALIRLVPEINREIMENQLKESFPASIVSANLEAFERGYDYVDSQLKEKEEIEKKRKEVANKILEENDTFNIPKRIRKWRLRKKR